MNNITMRELPQMNPTMLEDDDLILMWDVSEHKDWKRFRDEELPKSEVSMSDAPKPTRTIRLGDLRKHLNKREGILTRIKKFFIGE